MSRNDRLQPPYEGDHPAVQHRGVVLDHVQNPAFLDRLRKANSGGLIYIEVPCSDWMVPCSDWILRARAGFDIFYEHVNYFRFFADVRPVAESGRLFGGQSLNVVADLTTLILSAEGCVS
jgi:hypothetical protein